MFLDKTHALRRICDKKSSSGVIRVKKKPRVSTKNTLFSRQSMEVVVSWFLINDKTCLGGVRAKTHQVHRPSLRHSQNVAETFSASLKLLIILLIMSRALSL